MTNTFSSSQADRFSLVASFYGPGNIIAWLCIMASLFVTWCFNAEYRRKDNITTDLIFALAVPSVAAGHVIHLMFFPGLDEHETIQQLFTSLEPEVVQRAAAVEAALNVCETSAAAAVPLAFISIFYKNMTRTLIVIIVGLSAFSTEAMIFIQTKGVRVSASNLSRPFLFNFFEIMVSILAILIIWGLIFSITCIWLRIRTINSPEQIRVDPVNANLDADVSMALRNHSADEADEPVMETHLQEGRDRVAFLSNLPLLISFPMVILLAPISVSSGSGIFGLTNFMSSLSYIARLSFFVPGSATAITELDQIVSLSTGIITLSFSFWDAFKSQKKENEVLEREKRQQRAKEKRARRQQDLTFALRLLSKVSDRLDQTQDETEQQALLDKRNILIADISRMVGR